MGLKQRLEDDLKDAMRARDAVRLDTLRMVRADLLNAEKAGATAAELSDEQIVARLQTLIKQRRDAAEQFEAGGRPELAAKERAEIEVIAAYLPPAVTAEEVAAAVEEVIAATGATSARDAGKVTGQVMGRLKKTGKTLDGAAVQAAVRARLDG